MVSNNPETAYLLALPAELRNTIWALALPIEPQTFHFTFSIYTSVPPLLHVCPEIRQEVLCLYYAEAAFDLKVHHRNAWQLLDWIKSFDPAARKTLLKNEKVTIVMHVDEHHKRYEALKAHLGVLIAIWWETGWSFVLESTKYERGESLTRIDVAKWRSLTQRDHEVICPEDEWHRGSVYLTDITEKRVGGKPRRTRELEPRWRGRCLALLWRDCGVCFIGLEMMDEAIGGLGKGARAQESGFPASVELPAVVDERQEHYGGDLQIERTRSVIGNSVMDLSLEVSGRLSWCRASRARISSTVTN